MLISEFSRVTISWFRKGRASIEWICDFGLGPVDGFNQDEAAGERDERRIVLCGFLASQGDALETLELADGLLDPGSSLVEDLGEVFRAVDRDLAHRDHRHDAQSARGAPVALGVIAFVGQDRSRLDVRSDPEQQRELRAVTGLATSQMERGRLPIKVGLEVDFGREAATRPPKRLVLLPPFAPAAETWARTVVLSNICTRHAVGLSSASD